MWCNGCIIDLESLAEEMRAADDGMLQFIIFLLHCMQIKMNTELALTRLALLVR